jgi:alpha-D-ribose 1-methylphosphonate 5-triphosphate synthase subunit PhnH
MAFALLNADVTFFATGQYAGEVGAYLKTQTFASPVSAEEADFLFLNGADAMWIRQAKKGSLSYPEEGATLVLSVDQLAPDGSGLDQLAPDGSGVDQLAPDGSGVDQLAPDGGRRGQHQETDLSQGLRLTLTGPGIEKETHLGVWGLSRDFFKEWTACNQEFPLGVDLILADKSGRICALPRSTQINTIQLWDM